MLSEQERREIEAELPRYRFKQALSIEALMIVQRHRGWVSDVALEDVAAFLDSTVDELEAVATFYPRIYREPVGQHVVLYCDSVSCWIMGAERVRVKLAELLGVDLGQTSADGRFTLLPIVCLGACDHAPVMLVDEELFCDLEPAKLDAILAKYE
jgi:NADH-quinone oxidoreductase subunit E